MCLASRLLWIFSQKKKKKKKKKKVLMNIHEYSNKLICIIEH